MKNHIMIDLETMGNRSRSVITSISAVAFNIKTGEIANNYFESNISIAASQKLGMEINASTVLWWLEQSENARKLLIEGQKKYKENPIDVFDRFKNWLYVIASDNNTQIDNLFLWGNSPRFDLGLLNDYYYKLGEEIPWDFRKERDIRTIVSLDPSIRKNTKFDGTPHYGIDDCKYQIKYLVETLNKKGLTIM